MVRSSVTWLGVLAFALATPFAYPKATPPLPNVQPAPESEAQAEKDLIDGLIINRTITTLGWNFYRAFTAVWTAKYSKEHFSLVIYERPTARWGSEIWINYGQTRVFHSFLPPARSQTELISRAAVEAVYKSATEIKIQRALYADNDLAPEEM